MNSDDDPNVDTQISPINNATDNSYDSERRIPSYGIHYNDARMLTGDPYTNYATFADPVNGQNYPRKRRWTAAERRSCSTYQAHRQHGRQVHPRRPRLRQRVHERQRPHAVRYHADALHSEPRRAADELQFNGARARNERLGWTTGLFFFESESRAYNTTEFEAFNYTGALANFVANDGYTTDNQSAFVHVNVRLHGALRVSGGARYTDEEKTNTFDHGPALNRSDVPLIFGDSRTDWKLSVDFAVERQRLPVCAGGDGLQLGSCDAAHLHGRAAHGARRRGAAEQRRSARSSSSSTSGCESTGRCFRATTTRESARRAA